MSQALSFHAFATSRAHSGNFEDIADVRKHFNEHQYASWIGTAMNEYRQYLTDEFPEMTLREAAELTASVA